MIQKVMCASFFLIVIYYNVAGQGPKTKDLEVGEYLPKTTLTNVLYYSNSTVALPTDFRGKLIILDFGATWCAPCLAQFGKLDSLQKKFANDIQIVFVTQESGKKVTDFFSRFLKFKNIRIPATITDDKILRRYFRHKYMPHYVWLNESGKVLAITDGKEVNDINIAKVLRGEYIELPVKKDYHRVVKQDGNGLYTNQVVYYKNGDGTQVGKLISPSEIGFYSTITSSIKGLPGGGHTDSTHLSFFNLSIRYLYKMALSQHTNDMLNSREVAIEIPDSTLIEKITRKRRNPPQDESDNERVEWLNSNAYTYELKVPPSLSKIKLKIMLDDLNRYFGAMYGIEGVIQDRSQKYLSLVRIGSENLLNTKGGNSVATSDAFSINIRNGSMGQLVVQLFKPLQLHPFIIDETGYTGSFDMYLECQLSDLSALNRQLAKYGLSLEAKEKLMRTPVLRMKSQLSTE